MRGKQRLSNLKIIKFNKRVIMLSGDDTERSYNIMTLKI